MFSTDNHLSDGHSKDSNDGKVKLFLSYFSLSRLTSQDADSARYLNARRTCSSVLPGKVNLTIALLPAANLNLPLAFSVFASPADKLAVVFSVPVNNVSSPEAPLLAMGLSEWSAARALASP